jgi:hypothetical protein
MSDYSEYIKPFLKAFDEACAKAFENGANNEQERIIKLLENRKAEILNRQDADDLAMDLWVDGIVIRSIDYEIELIKEETNEPK